jgi:hypothetical protein
MRRTGAKPTAGCWTEDPESTRQLLALIFNRVWLEERRVVAVNPKDASLGLLRDDLEQTPPDRGG